MRYNPALDGLRAIAVVLVMLFHARAPAGLGGFLGVEVFFVLSGFLITGILLADVETHGRPRLLVFWGRRFVRLTPALLFMLAVYAIVAPLAWPDHGEHGLHVVLAGLYLSDYAVAYWGMPDILSHTWSLAVEQHFYVVWPLVIGFAARRWDRASLVKVLLAAFVIASLWRWTCAPGAGAQAAGVDRPAFVWHLSLALPHLPLPARADALG